MIGSTGPALQAHCVELQVQNDNISRRMSRLTEENNRLERRLRESQEEVTPALSTVLVPALSFLRFCPHSGKTNVQDDRGRPKTLLEQVLPSFSSHGTVYRL